MRDYLELFATFSKLGLFTFGGCYAMLPLLESEIVEKKKWATYDEITNYYAVGQCTPGIIAVNVSTFIGYYQKGVLGALVSTFGFVFPSLIIIIVIAAFIQNFASLAIVQHALAGLRVGVCVLVLTSVYKLIKNGVKDGFGVAMFIFAFVLSLFTNISVVFITLGAGLLGFLKYKLGGKKA